MNKAYLGDGLYAEFDGYGLWLRAEDGVRVLHEVYLEPQVFDAMLLYAVKHGMTRASEFPAQLTAKKG